MSRRCRAARPGAFPFLDKRTLEGYTVGILDVSNARLDRIRSDFVEDLRKLMPRNVNKSIGRSRAGFAAVLLILLLGLVSPTAGETAGTGAHLEVFTRATCPHCAAAEVFLESLRRERPALSVTIHEVDRDPVALQRLQDLAARNGVSVVGVPAFHFGGKLIVGFEDEERGGDRIRALLDGAGSDGDRITVPFFGSFAADDVGLVWFTIAIGLLDGFNPCAMWVLLFLLSLLVNVRDRARMLTIAGTFVVASGTVYFAFMAAWLNVFLLVGFSAAVRAVLGGVATFVGLVNVKDFFAFGRGITLSIPDAAKPGIYARTRRILQAENLSGALASVVVLALLANTVELLCTAGFPALYTHVLTQHQLSRGAYYAYLVLYNFAYMFDDSVMVATAVVTLDRLKLQERGGRWLKLVSGIVMLALGLTLLFRPEWLAFGQSRSHTAYRLPSSDQL